MDDLDANDCTNRDWRISSLIKLPLHIATVNFLMLGDFIAAKVFRRRKEVGRNCSCRQVFTLGRSIVCCPAASALGQLSLFSNLTYGTYTSCTPRQTLIFILPDT